MEEIDQAKLEDAEEGLEVFVTYFVHFFEIYILECYELLIHKTGKTSQSTNWVKRIASVVADGAKLCNDVAIKATVLGVAFGVSEGAVSYDLYVSRKKIKPLASSLFSFKNDRDLWRKTLVKGAGLIFTNLEAQFMNIKNSSKITDSSGKYAIMKLARGAANKVTQYWLKHPLQDVNGEFIYKSLVSEYKTSIWSKSTKKVLMELGLACDSVRLNGQPIKMHDMFQTLGIKGTDGSYYWRSNLKPKDYQLKNGVWFRLAEPWELEQLRYMYDKQPTPDNTYTYVLTPDLVNKKLKSIKLADSMNPNELKEYLNQIREDIVEYINMGKDRIKIISTTIAGLIESLSDDIAELVETSKITVAKLDAIAASSSENVNMVTNLTVMVENLLGMVSRRPSHLQEPYHAIEEREEPIWTVKKPRLFIGRDMELVKLNNFFLGRTCSEDTSSGLSRIAVITGDDGFGKSQFSSNFVELFKDQFFDAVWLDAHSEGTLKSSFIQLAGQCGIREARRMDTLDVVSSVYAFFNSRKAPKKNLMIFDDAKKLDYFMLYIGPLTARATSPGNTYVLITSREEGWSEWVNRGLVFELHLGKFHRQDAELYIKSKLEKNGVEIDENDTKRLLSAVPQHPLALNLVASYVSEQTLNGATLDQVIGKIVKFWSRLQRPLSECECFRNDDDDDDDHADSDDDYAAINQPMLCQFCYLRGQQLVNESFSSLYPLEYRVQSPKLTINTLWKEAIDEVSLNERCGTLAVQIMKMIAFFRPVNIPIGIFSNLENVHDGDVLAAVDLLTKYGLVDKDEKVLSVPTMVQEVTRSEMLHEELIDVLRITVHFLVSTVHKYQEIDPEADRFLPLIQPHIEALMGHLSSALGKLERDTDCKGAGAS